MSGASATDNVVTNPGVANQSAADVSARAGSCADLVSGSAGGSSGDNAGKPLARCNPIGGGGDLLAGTRTRDWLVGGPGSQRIRGKGGNDRIKAGRGRDCLFGNRGRDRLYAADGMPDTVRCGRGRDVAIVDRKDHVRHCERVVRR